VVVLILAYVILFISNVIPRKVDSDMLDAVSHQDWLNIQTEAYVTDGWWVGLSHRNTWDWVQYGGDSTLM